MARHFAHRFGLEFTRDLAAADGLLATCGAPPTTNQGRLGARLLEHLMT